MKINNLLSALLFISLSSSVYAESMTAKGDAQTETIKLASKEMDKRLEEAKSLLYQRKITIDEYKKIEEQSLKMEGYYKNVTTALKTQQSSDRTDVATETVCIATDVNSWIDCKNKIVNGKTKKILVEKDINCSKADDCNLGVSDSSDLIITASRNSSLYRAGGLGRPFIHFNNIKNGEISNLVINEAPNNPIQLSKGAQEINEECKDYNYNCESMIKVEKSTNMIVKNVKISNAKLFGLSLYDNESVYVQDSEISKSWWFGIWGGANKKLYISKTHFLNNRSNGALIDFNNTVEVKIVDSLFRGNHHATAFHVCDGGKGPCPGGQIDFLNQVQNLTVENNIFEDGKMSGEFPEDNNINWVSGIEFEPHDGNIQNVIIKNNLIKNNSGSAFFVNAPSAGRAQSFVADIIFADNQLCSNRTQENYPNGSSWGKQIKIVNNKNICGGQDINAKLSANSCAISERNEVCSINVKWEASADSVCVWSGDKLWACEGRSGAKDYPYVGTNPTSLILRDGKGPEAVELARIVVTAQLSSATLKAPIIRSFGTGCNDGNCGWLVGENFTEGMTVDLRSVINGEMIQSGINTVIERDKKTITFAVPKHLHERFKNEGFNVFLVDSKNGVWSNSILFKK